MTPSVHRRELKRMPKIADGGFGTVYRADSSHAYKEFKSASETHVHPAKQADHARAAVDFFDSLSPADRAMLARYAAWPEALVHDNRGVCGFLMPLLQRDFFLTLSPGGKPMVKPCDLSWLAESEENLRYVGAALPHVDAISRVVISAQVACVIALLHKHAWRYGDISFANVLFTPDPPRIKLVDCDAAAPAADTRRTQAHSLLWRPPECEGPGGLKRQDSVTDTYKLALLVLRVITQRMQARNPEDLEGTFDDDGIQLIRRALSADRHQRPSSLELYSYLRAAVLELQGPPVISAVSLSAHTVIRGGGLHINWSVRNATEAVIRLGDRGEPVHVDLELFPDGYSLSPLAGGTVVIRFRNHYAEAAVSCGFVSVYELPGLDNWLLPPAAPAGLTLPGLGQPGLRSALDEAGPFDELPRTEEIW